MEYINILFQKKRISATMRLRSLSTRTTLEKREIDPSAQFAPLQIASLNDALYVAHKKWSGAICRSWTGCCASSISSTAVPGDTRQPRALPASGAQRIAVSRARGCGIKPRCNALKRRERRLESVHGPKRDRGGGSRRWRRVKTSSGQALGLSGP
jgi:hypothetical protein